MRRPLYSLRTRILANLIFLILAAMLLINVVMIKLAENDLVRSRVRSGIALANSIALAIAAQSDALSQDISIARRRWLNTRVREILKQSDFSEFIFVPSGPGRRWKLGKWKTAEHDAVALCRQSIVTQKPSIGFRGTTWAVTWLGYQIAEISVPVKSGTNTVGAIAIRSHLDDIYSHLRKTEKLILIYISLNTFILLAAGMYLLSRVVIRPIRRLLKITEEFKEDEPLALVPEPSANEMGQLFHSLRMMLTRLDENKQQLKAHIASLERANEKLRRTQEEVIRSEKLASVGRLAAGVAHEVGNPIGVVLGYLDLMKNGELSRAEIKDALQRCESEIGRINKIIRQLLDYSRPAPPAAKHVSVHSLLSESIEMLEPQPIMRGITIDMTLVSPKDIVMGDESRLKQVFINVLLNAADAIKEKQKRRLGEQEKKIVITTQNSEGTIKISFQDTGCGIPEDSIKRIFDPFYSTKEPGKGTGLGLSVSYRIVEQMGGKMRAESKNGHGSIIQVILPLADGEETEEIKKVSSSIGIAED